MKIRKIRYENHSLFGNTEFDFTDSEGNVIDTIIIAGENGVGKSRLMEDIYALATFKYFTKPEDKVIHFEIELSDDQIRQLEQPYNLLEMDLNFGKIFNMTLNFNNVNDYGALKVENILTNESKHTIEGRRIAENPILKAIFSNSEVNFTPEPIKNIKTSDIDAQSSSTRSDSKLATNISQLLVDIQTLDANELNNWVKNNLGKAPTDDIIDTRMKRFTNAFSYMFPTKKYERIENTIEGKEVIFSEGSNEMTLNQLSSGEKQIVFRGGFLLQNKESSKGALVLIDEPELSLHPKWQIKSLDFFKKLFSDLNGIQTSQLIITTHSPFIIHNPNRSNDKVIILKKDDTGQTYIAQNPTFANWTNEEAIQEAFSIDFSSFNNDFTVFLEGETDEKYFNTAKRIFNHADLPFTFQWIGRMNEQNNAENTGDKSLNHAISYLRSNENQVKNKIIFLYDNDTKKSKEEFGKVYIRRMQDPISDRFKKGVESLLDIAVIVNIDDFYTTREKTDDYGATSLITELDKMKLCNFICDGMPLEEQEKVLININEEINKLKALL